MADPEQTFVMDQGEVLVNDQVFQATFNCSLDDPKRAGICTGLSMLWVRNFITHHKWTPAQRKEGLKTAAAYRRAGETQDIHNRDIRTVESLETWVQRGYGAALSRNGLRAVGTSLIYKESPDSELLAKAMEAAAKTKYSYRIYFLQMQPITSRVPIGHVVASYASSGKLFGFGRHLYFFDCQIGEFKAEIGDTKKMLKGWLEAYQGQKIKLLDFRSFAVETGV